MIAAMKKGIVPMRRSAFGCVVFFALAFAQSSHGAVTFNKDVLPILQAKCQTCHRPGEAGPMSFLTFESTRPWAKAIRGAVVSRKMPPWGLDPKYGHFANDPSLTQEQIDTLSQWAERGALEGDKKDAPPPVEWPKGWRSTPDVIVSLPPMSVPAKGYLEWTDVTIPSPFKEDTWITAMEVRPGVPAVMHHAGVRFAQHKDGVLYNVPVWVDIKRDASGYEIPGDAKPQMVTYCKEDSTKLCPAPANAIVEGGNFEGFYRPGSAPIDYRLYDSAYLIPGNTDIVVQVHYSPNGQAVTDVTKIGFTLAKREPERELKMWGLQPAGGMFNRKTFRIPAGDSNWKAPPSDVVFNMDTELALLSIHMHERGKAMMFTLTYPDGKSEIVMNQPRYNFNWQFYYNLAQPIKIPKGTKLHVDAWFDNSANNPFNRDPSRDVYSGEQSWEEMMGPWIGLILPRNVDVNKVLTLNGGADPLTDRNPITR
jgi:hypothetical protein